MNWWQKTKSVIGLDTAFSPEDADRFPDHKALLSDDALLNLSRKAVDRFESQDDDVLISILGSTNEAIPAEGCGRRNWIRSQIMAAMTYPRSAAIYECDEFLHKKISATLRRSDIIESLLDRGNIHQVCETIAANIARRYITLCSAGLLLINRIEAETEYLSKLENLEIYKRFSGVPLARIDAIPATEKHRQQWVREVLIGESACVRLRLVTSEVAFSISQRIKVGLPEMDQPIPEAVKISTGPEVDLSPWEHHAEMAVRFSEQRDDDIKKRFQKLPNIEKLVVPPAKAMRTEWVKLAFCADHIRRVSGLSDWSEEYGGSSAVMAIELLGIRIHQSASSQISFEGTLVLDGQRICEILSPGNSEIQAFGWSKECGLQDLAALSRYIASTGPLRDSGRPDSLFDRLLDQVAMHVSLSGYRAAAEQCVLFLPNGTEPPMTLLSVAVPENGTRSGAISHIRSQHPDSVILDEISEEDAAMIWTTLA